MTPDQRDQFHRIGEQHARGRRPRDNTRLGIWLTFAGTVLAAVIGGIFALLAAGAGKSDPPATAAPQPAQRTTGPAAPAPATGATSPAAVEAGAPVRWSGRLVASSGGLNDAVDLDARPPRSLDDTAREGDLSVHGVVTGEFDLRTAALGAPSSFALWEGAGAPDVEQCRDAASAQGVTEASDIENGAVVCVLTNKDRIARLTVQKISTQQDTVTFDAVIWDTA